MEAGKEGPRNRRRVLHVITTLEPAGAQTQLIELVRRLDPARFEVWIAHLHRPKHVRALASEGSVAPSIRIVDLSRGGRFDPFVLPRLRSLIRRERIDLVHTHLVHAGILGKLAAKAERRPVVTTRHYASEGKERRWTYRWEDRLTARADCVIAVSEAVRRHLVTRGVVDAAKIRVISNAIDLARFEPTSVGREPDPVRRPSREGPSDSSLALRSTVSSAEPGPVIGTVGRLSAQKGHDILLRAFAPLHASHGARLEFVGAGPRASELSSLAQTLGVGHAVRFHGAVTPSRVPSILAGWDLFAFPSRWEAFGLALLEAMAMELPIVASGVEGILELVTPEVNGRLVPVEDLPGKELAAWTEALRGLLDDPVSAREMGRRARSSIAARYDIGAAARSLAELYEGLLP